MFGLILGVMLFSAPAMANVPGGDGKPGDVTLTREGDDFRLANGSAIAVVHGPDATITSLIVNGTERVNKSARIKHTEIYWSMDGGKDYQRPARSVCTLHAATKDMADVGCKAWYDGSQPHAFDIDIHYVLRRGASGVYTYAILSHPASYPATRVGEWRIVWQTPVVDDAWLMERIYADKDRHWNMPTVADYADRIHTPIKEITIMKQGGWAGKAESKYTYSANYEDIGAFGFASDVHKVGAFMVLGGYDYYNDGPRKQDLTVLEGMMTHHINRNHYTDTVIEIPAGENWSKIFGPFLLYGNGGSRADALWLDAQKQAAAERAAWPYAWLDGYGEYPADESRGGISGDVQIFDQLKPGQIAANAWVGLAQPPVGKDFQSTAKTYQYWVKADENGHFSIAHVRPGIYMLYVFTDGETGQYEQNGVVIQPGKIRNIGTVRWDVLRQGSKIAWEIGVPDRDTREFRHGNDFYLPYLYKNFTNEFHNPLIYNVVGSNSATDWNYAHTAWHPQNGVAMQWPWQVKFTLHNVQASGNARLILALAGANKASLRVRVNDHDLETFTPEFNVGNALLRQSSHSKYMLKTIQIPVSMLHAGENALELTQMNLRDESAVLYDYLALEMP